MNIWDNAPLLPILAEAGGRFTDWTGAARIDGGDAVSTNGILHDAVLSLLPARLEQPDGAASGPLGQRPDTIGRLLE